ncbi:hypothetical protein [Roseomonas elaeocarpi]|uniref:Uncharacterized protein n=1 Tax=Roseomonas elaeocarpi TaxID=907779 RepID=A0ABV6JXG6_9PROT
MRTTARLRLVFCALLLSAVLPAAAQARDDGLEVTAAVGGSVPLPQLGGDAIYLSADLLGGHVLKVGKSVPMLAQVKNVWDARPQLMIGGRYPIAELPGLGQLSVSGLVSGALEAAPEEPRPVVGLAKLQLRF